VIEATQAQIESLFELHNMKQQKIQRCPKELFSGNLLPLVLLLEIE
jgi:hypothetical protein